MTYLCVQCDNILSTHGEQYYCTFELCPNFGLVQVPLIKD